jgi:diaminohydroxyphosphoribosylaminopyrimidine deaminase/5-amino-6-(5-phosphoribosylamino)uracil reductase
VNLLQLMEQLGQEQIDSILLEGGGTLNWSALESGIVQQVQAYIAPKLFRGRDAKAPIEGAGVPLPDAAFRLKNSRLEQLGEDFLIESEVEYPCLPESWKKSEQ